MTEPIDVERPREREIDPLPWTCDEVKINTLTETSVRSCTGEDVARLAGVSTATVSRVVNGADNVSCNTRTRVLNAISRLQYIPNAYAAELGRTGGGISKKPGLQALALARSEDKADF